MKQGKQHISAIISILLATAMVLISVQPVLAYLVNDDDEPVHEHIVQEAIALYSQFYDHPEINNALSTIQSGAGHEDVYDHVTDRSGIYTTITHFWDADKGDDDPVDMLIIGENGINSWQKAQVLWGMALGEYAHEDYGASYEYLGHVAHLLADMTVPAHAHEDAHPSETFEKDYMLYSNGNALLSNDEQVLLIQQGLVQILDGIDPLYYLFYTANQIGDYYPSDDYDGDTDTRGGWMDGVYAELGMYPLSRPVDNPGDCVVIRHYAYLYAIRSVATLYGLFYDEAHSHSALTIVIDHISALDTHDEGLVEPSCYADFFVNVYINGARYWNEGDQVVNDDDIYPHWAFGRNVGITGIIPIIIQVWDEDEEGTPGGDDDKSDIDPVEDRRDLDFNVDLATGAISGDITGICGSTLTISGSENDASQIWFRVLLPNIPPTADAGPNQMVNEGDTVTLEGTFTDPNVGDTHTFLWHMESSTNSQVIPDSSGPALPEPSTQPFSFVPCDNGVYTFSFTVTDNYGAQGSDEVVVTVLNVPPMVSTLYISTQENAQFILPVVHNTYFRGTFTDAGTCDTHTALWTWGDGTTSNGNVTETNGSGSVTNSHTYSLPGDYTVKLTITDDDGGSDYKTMTVHVADADEALDIFNAYIQSLPNSRFKNSANQRKDTFSKMFLSLDLMLAVENYGGMILSMNSNIRAKFDGLVGGSPKNDWIKQDLAIQTELCQKVDDITAYLEYLLALMP